MNRAGRIVAGGERARSAEGERQDGVVGAYLPGDEADRGRRGCRAVARVKCEVAPAAGRRSVDLDESLGSCQGAVKVPGSGGCNVGALRPILTPSRPLGKVSYAVDTPSFAAKPPVSEADKDQYTTFHEVQPRHLGVLNPVYPVPQRNTPIQQRTRACLQQNKRCLQRPLLGEAADLQRRSRFRGAHPPRSAGRPDTCERPCSLGSGGR